MRGALYLLLGIAIGLGCGRLLWFEPAPALIAPLAEQSPAASRPLRPAASPTAFEALERRIIAAMQARDYAGAIELLIEADLVAELPGELEQVTRLLDEAVSQRVRQLLSRQQPADVDALYERLSLIMPERAEFYILLAEHRIAMDNGAAALPVLAQIENHHQLGGLARQLIEQITRDSQPDDSLASLPVERSGNQYIVRVTIDEVRQAALLIDTGASMTTLTPDVLASLGYDLTGPRANFSTASGVVQAPVVQLRSLALGPASVSQVTVGALAFERPSGTVDGLLGMNVLRQFEFSLDQQAAQLKLWPARNN